MIYSLVDTILDKLLGFFFESWLGRIVGTLVLYVAFVVLLTWAFHGTVRIAVWAWRIS